MVAPIALGILTTAQVRTHLAINIAMVLYSRTPTRGEKRRTCDRPRGLSRSALEEGGARR
jgi:hypothetical protein